MKSKFIYEGKACSHHFRNTSLTLAGVLQANRLHNLAKNVRHIQRVIKGTETKSVPFRKFSLSNQAYNKALGSPLP